jgi:hypothetical protein
VIPQLAAFGCPGIRVVVGGDGGLVEEVGELGGECVGGVGVGGGGDEEGFGVEVVFGEEEGEVVGGDGVVAGPGVAVVGVEVEGGVAGGCGWCGGGW